MALFDSVPQLPKRSWRLAVVLVAVLAILWGVIYFVVQWLNATS